MLLKELKQSPNIRLTLGLQSHKCLKPLQLFNISTKFFQSLNNPSMHSAYLDEFNQNICLDLIVLFNKVVDIAT